MSQYFQEALPWVNRRARCALNGENWPTTAQDMKFAVSLRPSLSTICERLAGFYYVDYVYKINKSTNRQIKQPDAHLNRLAKNMLRFVSSHLWTRLLFGFKDLGLCKPGQSFLPILVKIRQRVFN